MKKRKTKVCANCHTEFEKPRHVNKVNWAKMQFCSMPCYGAFKKKRILLPCDYCGKESEVKQANKNRYKRHFCDADCYALFQKHLMPKEEHGRFGKGELSEQEQIKRRRARSILNHHLRDKNIQRPPCEICGNVKSEAHHDDYDKPLEVRWLCFRHHRLYHKIGIQAYQHPNLLPSTTTI